MNTTDTPYTIPTHKKIAELQILKPDHTKNIRPIDVAALKVLEDPNDTITYVNELMKADSDFSETDRFWLPTPENPGNEAEHTPIQKRILKEIRELEQNGKLNLTEDSASRELFLKVFQWKDSLMQGKEKQQLEDVIIEYNDNFARHRLDIGINNDFKVKLTPKNENPVYTQSLPVPINLKEDLTVYLALMHRYG